ncbi:MAG: electron transport complex subunit E [Candidatus Omnitrophota bacterium]|jgi:electron transport complex protein RnfE|nr:electron transport complex subunit E [Candidatus Omnitrophota bacterium]MDD4981797.1 electron transport complex subunit E [Candidatus Omnitrophota bacterium]MDD5665283.1 electron transport complex subunit E [Candidatus Omnitrophota bacterium]
MKSLIKEFSKGITVLNPTFGLILGLCPTLAVSTSLFNAVGMGVAATFVLVFSNLIISALRNFIPARIRLPSYIVIIATFVTVCELGIKAYLPGLSKSLGIFIPLIVVNCIIMARAEAFASRNRILPSIFDGLGMGVGFTLGIAIIAFIRELLGSGSIAGIGLLKSNEFILVMILAPGALLTMGLLIALSRLMGLTKR